MKRFVVAVVFLVLGYPAQAETYHLYKNTPWARTTASALLLKPEAPMRCSLNSMSRELSTTVPVDPRDFSVDVNPFNADPGPRLPLLLRLPPSRQLMLAVADSLRGMGIEELMFDWKGHKILFYGDQVLYEKVKRLVASFASTNYVVVYDITMFRVFGTVDWTSFVQAAGVDTVIAEKKALVGHYLIVDSRINRRNITDFLMGSTDIGYQATGNFYAPSRYTADFALGQCYPPGAPEEKLAFTAKASMFDGVVSSELKMRSKRGSVATYETLTSLDQNIMIVGVPLAALDPLYRSGELVLLVSPRLLKTVEVDGPPAPVVGDQPIADNDDPTETPGIMVRSDKIVGSVPAKPLEFPQPTVSPKKLSPPVRAEVPLGRPVVTPVPARPQKFVSPAVSEPSPPSIVLPVDLSLPPPLKVEPVASAPVVAPKATKPEPQELEPLLDIDMK